MHAWKITGLLCCGIFGEGQIFHNKRQKHEKKDDFIPLTFPTIWKCLWGFLIYVYCCFVPITIGSSDL
jgi:hypothetical protein